MLNWLKKKARVTLNSRYNNILGRNNQSEMIITDQNMVNSEQNHSENLKIYIYSMDGDGYSLDVSPYTTVERVKSMAIGHFYSPLEAVGASIPNENTHEWSEGWSTSSSYRLVLTRESRNLRDENSVSMEKLCNNDELLLMESRKSALNTLPSQVGSTQANHERIVDETNNLTPKNLDRLSEFHLPSLDFKIAVRKILLTMIKVSAHLISSEEDCVDVFIHIFQQLEKKHRPRVDASSLRQLTEMGFPEVRAAHALFLRRTVQGAMDWLLDESNSEFNDFDLENTLFKLSETEKKEYFLGRGKDPADALLEQFNTYIKKWFQAEPKALQALKTQGYGEDVAKEALRASCNNELAACSLLEGDSSLVDDIQKGFDRDSPIMVGILESPIVQIALCKPKILYALMAMYENPNSTNVYLSDPDTHPLVSQVLRIYHAEKYRLCKENNPAFKIPLNSTSRGRSENFGIHYGNSDVSPHLVSLPNALREASASNSTANSPTISMRIESNSNQSTPRIRRIQPPLEMPFQMNYLLSDFNGASSSLTPNSQSQDGPPSSTPEVTHLTVTYIPPTTEDGVPTLSLRLGGPSALESQNSSQDGNDDVDMQ